MPRDKCILGITPGDPAGIGPELLPAALEAGKDSGVEMRVIGDPAPTTPGKPDETGSRRALEALEEAARLAEKGEIHGVVTGPVCKHGLHRIGFPFPGQTEFFAARAGADNFAMLLTGGGLTVALATIHIPLADVPRLLTVEKIINTGLLLDEFLRNSGIESPDIGVAGLNPHAGENGEFGREEIDIIQPAVKELAARLGGSNISGPHPPDTVFHHASRGAFDAVLCMYHDQGLIPLKLHAFETGVNVTLGLPFVRVSPDHGTAFDIAGTGKADPSSMIAAVHLASGLLFPRRVRR